MTSMIKSRLRENREAKKYFEYSKLFLCFAILILVFFRPTGIFRKSQKKRSPEKKFELKNIYFPFKLIFSENSLTVN